MFRRHQKTTERKNVENGKIVAAGLMFRYNRFKPMYGMTQNELSILGRYVPSPSLKYLDEYLSGAVTLQIVAPRKTRLGDYRPPYRTPEHKIKVNGDLNQYAFLLVLIHELAHMKTWIKYERSVKPHGEAWRKSYRELMAPLLNETVFPEPLLQAVSLFLDSFTPTMRLMLSRALKGYDEREAVFVENLSVGTIFRVNDGRKFKIEEKLRKRYKCYCIDDKRNYLFSPLYEIAGIEKEV